MINIRRTARALKLMGQMIALITTWVAIPTAVARGTYLLWGNLDLSMILFLILIIGAPVFLLCYEFSGGDGK